MQNLEPQPTEEKQETKEEDKPTSEEETTPSEQGSIVDKAEKLFQGITDAEKRIEELVKRQEAAASKIILGGRAYAGEPRKTKEEEEKDKVQEQADAALSRFR